ncbi:hypothetical protein Anapl_12450 [Anas platyrhynchos]|uniref:Uncharacterized protein n=1 Tax=Anas platyrhynchos TaxID=8839 RepID=R0L0S9_ANAPL|nr:hypothetical protein Anapl_12450 [Anas platyrhynchos]
MKHSHGPAQLDAACCVVQQHDFKLRSIESQKQHCGQAHVLRVLVLFGILPLKLLKAHYTGNYTDCENITEATGHLVASLPGKNHSTPVSHFLHRGVKNPTFFDGELNKLAEISSGVEHRTQRLMFVLYQSCKIPVIDYIGTMFERNPRAGIGLGGNCELRGVSSPCCASSSTLHLVGEVTGQNPRKPIVKNMTVVNYIQPSLIWKGLTHTGYAVIL